MDFHVNAHQLINRCQFDMEFGSACHWHTFLYFFLFCFFLFSFFYFSDPIIIIIFNTIKLLYLFPLVICRESVQSIIRAKYVIIKFHQRLMQSAQWLNDVINMWTDNWFILFLSIFVRCHIFNTYCLQLAPPLQFTAIAQH